MWTEIRGEPRLIKSRKQLWSPQSTQNLFFRHCHCLSLQCHCCRRQVPNEIWSGISLNMFEIWFQLYRLLVLHSIRLQWGYIIDLFISYFSNFNIPFWTRLKASLCWKSVPPPVALPPHRQWFNLRWEIWCHFEKYKSGSQLQMWIVLDCNGVIVDLSISYFSNFNIPFWIRLKASLLLAVCAAPSRIASGSKWKRFEMIWDLMPFWNV